MRQNIWPKFQPHIGDKGFYNRPKQIVSTYPKASSEESLSDCSETEIKKNNIYSQE